MTLLRQLRWIVLPAVLGGCSLLQPPPPAPPPAPPPLPPPLATTQFTLDPASNLVGELQVMQAKDKDTFIDIAQAYDLGYDELVEANPGIDPWMPKAGTDIILPSRFILPEAPREGIVLNVASKRLFYFPKATKGAPAVVHTFPISIGREGWATPLGKTRVVSKKKDPVWRVPASIRKEHAENGDPLPAVVPPGPDNPLGAYAMRLALPGDYLIHGTNKPAGVGMRVSHGCIRMNPEDIDWLFPQVPVGLPVHIVNQPLLIGAAGGDLYVEAHPALEEDKAKHVDALRRNLQKRLAKAGRPLTEIDSARLASITTDRRGIPVSVMAQGPDQAATVAAARRVANVVTYDWFNETPAEEPPAAQPAPAAGKPSAKAAGSKPAASKPAAAKPAASTPATARPAARTGSTATP
jgi:L,D-transpeptidase ErfK/SrfK